MIRAEKVDGGTQIMIEGTLVDVTAELCHVMERGIVIIRNKLNLDYDGSYESVMYALIKTVTENLEEKEVHIDTERLGRALQIGLDVVMTGDDIAERMNIDFLT